MKTSKQESLRVIDTSWRILNGRWLHWSRVDGRSTRTHKSQCRFRRTTGEEQIITHYKKVSKASKAVNSDLTNLRHRPQLHRYGCAADIKICISEY